MNARILAGALCVLITGVATTLRAETPASADTSLYAPAPAHRDGIGKAYMGRPIASVMGWQAAGWLERPERSREEDSTRLVRGLGLRPGMVVADVGAGSGYYARRFAAEVGPSGKVFAVDVQPQMVAMLKTVAAQAGFENIVPVLSEVRDVKLAPATVDLAVMVDVYHELEFPYEVLASVVRAVKPGGRVVFVEYKAEDDAVPIKPLHKMSVTQIRREAEVHGLKLVDSVRGLPWQHALIFERPRAAP